MCPRHDTPRSTGSQRHPDGNIAIAVDFNVIPRPDWGKTVLQDGSKIIIIKAVQGG